MNNTPTATDKVADQLVDLCNAGKFQEAMEQLYAENARHIEPMEHPGSPYKRITEGKPTLLKMSEEWTKNTEVHSLTCTKPRVNGDQFACDMAMDCTSKQGPMAGKRMQVTETCLYTVKDGKITEAKFFYNFG